MLVKIFVLVLLLATCIFVFTWRTQQYAATAYPNFRGIYLFSSHNASTLANNPNLQGTNLVFYWSQIEPQKGQFDWTPIDQAGKPWTDIHKKVILRISACGRTSWDPPYSGKATPQWVYAEGVQNVTRADGSICPQYWNTTYLQELQTFLQAYAKKYDGDPNVAYIQVTAGEGGETKVDTNSTIDLQAWQNIGYTDQVWWDTLQKIFKLHTDSFHTTPLALLPDGSFVGKTSGYGEGLILDYAVAHTLWLQDNGLIAPRSLSTQFQQVPHPEEQRLATNQSGDTLQADIQAALDVGGNYILIFQSDITPANQATLQWATSLIPSTSGTNVPSSPLPTVASSSGQTPFVVTICPHGLGNCGDNKKSPGIGNSSPVHTQRNVSLTVFDTNNKPINTQQGTVLYNPSAQNFQGTIPIANLTSGNYLVSVKMDGFLSKTIPGIISVNQGQQVTLATIAMATGDINNDNQIDILDYNILITCYGSKQTTASCTASPSSTAAHADLDDNGKIDGTDYNLFLREISTQPGTNVSTVSALLRL